MQESTQFKVEQVLDEYSHILKPLSQTNDSPNLEERKSVSPEKRRFMEDPEGIHPRTKKHTNSLHPNSYQLVATNLKSLYEMSQLLGVTKNEFLQIVSEVTN